ncbi:hypothetical protein HK405_012354, partial [Cladochytrium tenue]
CSRFGLPPHFSAGLRVIIVHPNNEEEPVERDEDLAYFLDELPDANLVVEVGAGTEERDEEANADNAVAIRAHEIDDGNVHVEAAALAEADVGRVLAQAEESTGRVAERALTSIHASAAVVDYSSRAVAVLGPAASANAVTPAMPALLPGPAAESAAEVLRVNFRLGGEASWAPNTSTRASMPDAEAAVAAAAEQRALGFVSAKEESSYETYSNNVKWYGGHDRRDHFKVVTDRLGRVENQGPRVGSNGVVEHQCDFVASTKETTIHDSFYENHFGAGGFRHDPVKAGNLNEVLRSHETEQLTRFIGRRMQDGSDMIDGSTDRSYERPDGVLVRNEEHVKARIYEQSLHRENGQIKFQGEERLISQEGVFVDTETLRPSESTAKFQSANVKVTSARQLRKEGTFKGASKEDRSLLDTKLIETKLYQSSDGGALLSASRKNVDGSTLSVNIHAAAATTEHRVDTNHQLRDSTEGADLVSARFEARGTFEAHSGLKTDGDVRYETYSKGDVHAEGQGDIRSMKKAELEAAAFDGSRIETTQGRIETKRGTFFDKTTVVETTTGTEGKIESATTEHYVLSNASVAGVAGAAGAATAEAIQLLSGAKKATAGNAARAAGKVAVAAVEAAALTRVGSGSPAAVAAQACLVVGGQIMRATLDGDGYSAADMQKAAAAAAPAAGAVGGRAALNAAGLRAAGPLVSVAATAWQRRGELTSTAAAAD